MKRSDERSVDGLAMGGGLAPAHSHDYALDPSLAGFRWGRVCIAWIRSNGGQCPAVFGGSWVGFCPFSVS